MQLLAFRSMEVSRAHLPTKCVRKPSFAAMFEYSPKKPPKMAKKLPVLS